MMVKEAHSALGHKASRKQILQWVLQKYPGTKKGTIGCQTTICTVNNPVRVQFEQNSRPRTELGRYDFLFEDRAGALVSYSPTKHGRWIIVRGKGGQTAIRRVTRPAVGASRDSQLHVFFCGSPDENKDYAYLSNMATKGGSDRWSGVKNAYAGDRVLFYTVKDRRAFVASGWILEDAEPTNDPSDYPYRAKVGSIQLLDRPVAIEHVRERFPAWGWPRYTRYATTVPQRMTDSLWALIHELACTQPPPLSATTRTSSAGTGFGNPKTNRLVEQAAVAKVTKLLQARGFTVDSRERENIGYDLDATKGFEVMHVEVKGRAGAGDVFIITQNEVSTARIDPHFRLFLVSNARTKRASVTEYSGPEFLAAFALSSVSYRAVLK